MESKFSRNAGSLPLVPSTQPMTCRRCGVCCTMHQAWVRPPEIARIADFLGITVAEWETAYLDSRWQYNNYHLVRHVSGACAFLAHENGLAACAIQPVKPDCCAAWQADLDKAECRNGMEGRPLEVDR